jgi:hypothetical protein
LLHAPSTVKQENSRPLLILVNFGLDLVPHALI